MAMMTGGWSPVKDMNSTDLQKCVEFATDEISLGMNSLYHMRQIEILKAEKQVCHIEVFLTSESYLLAGYCNIEK